MRFERQQMPSSAERSKHQFLAGGHYRLGERFAQRFTQLGGRYAGRSCPVPDRAGFVEIGWFVLSSIHGRIFRLSDDERVAAPAMPVAGVTT